MHTGTVVGVGGLIGDHGICVATPIRSDHCILRHRGQQGALRLSGVAGNVEHRYRWYHGSGIGGSRSKLGYLPLAHSDFIFAIIADELGLIGVLVLGGFTLLTILDVQTAIRQIALACSSQPV